MQLLKVAVFAVAIAAAPVVAQSQSSSVLGQWQGIRYAGDRDFRMVISLSDGGAGQVRGEVVNVDSGGMGTPIRAVAISGNAVTLSLPGGIFEGLVSADRKRISGIVKAPDGSAGAEFELKRVSGKEAWISPHETRMVTVEKGVDLEVLDWGGKGRALIFLAGGGADAHQFDKFAPMFTSGYHVFGISRRGSGISGKPALIATNYTNDKLGDDIIAVMDALKLNQAILIGHSFAGSEMSNVALRRPERVAALVYLDAALDFAYYAPGNAGFYNLLAQTADIRQLVEKMVQGTPQQAENTISEVLKDSLPELEADLEATQKLLKQTPPQPARQAPPQAMDLAALGVEKYPPLTVPVIAIYKGDQLPPPNAPAAMVEAVRADNERNEQIVQRFRQGNPSAKVVVLSNANHAVWVSHEGVVHREVIAFLSTLHYRPK